ncbi:MAG: hypothetical protein FJZ47_16700, partial [Candidatus Tectomicrobia bacterium]|nr:hypothetical protein [Candidatus Tectomicrobia bacterium]
MLQRLPRSLRLPWLSPAYRPGTRQHATRRLRILLSVSLACLALPLALLLSRVYHHLAREVFLQHRAVAEDAVRQVNQRLAELLRTEEARPFDEYSFLKVAVNPLFKGSALAASPLSEFPPQSALPGVIGYFQVNPDGTLQSPVLPELDEQDLSANVDRFGFGSAELTRRLALRNRLEELLLHGAPVRDQRRRQQQASQPATEPAFAADTAVPNERDAHEQASSDRKVTPSSDTPKAEVTSRAILADKPPIRKDKAALPAAEAPPQATPAQKTANPRSPSPYRERRKEQVTLPEQSTVAQVQEALDSLSSLSRETGRKTNGRGGAASQSPAEESPTKKRRTVQVLTFESEVDPFQMTVLPSGHLVFFRKAWRNNVRYIQGFVADQSEFLQYVIGMPLSTTALGQLASLTVQAQGQELFSRPPGEGGEAARTPHLLYHAALEVPLDAVELFLHTGR